MDIQRGYIRLFRQFEDWEWYDNPLTKAIFIHCLLKANDRAKKWRDLTVKRGQFVTSYEKLAAANGMTIQQTRTVLKQLQSTNEIEYQSTNQYTLITIKNYNLYQASNIQKLDPDIIPTNKQNGGQVTTTNNNSINTSINISSSSSIEEFEKFYKNLEEEEEETLKIFSKKEKIKCFRPWLRKIYNNGDYEEVKKQAYEYKYRLEAAQKIKEEQKLELEQQKQQERELTEEERKIFLQKAREKAGINKLRRAKK